MINLFKFRKIHKRKHITIIFIILLVLFFSCIPQNFYNIVYKVYNSQTMYVKKITYKTKEFLQNFPDFKLIQKENEDLKKSLELLKSKIQTIKNAEIELYELKKSLNFNYSESNNKHIEKVLGFDANIYNSNLIISTDNVNTKSGKIVLSSTGLVGVVIERYKNFAYVKTVCDSNFVVPVKSNSERLIVSGNDDNQMISKEIKDISALQTLKKGDVFETSGEGGFFPANIPISTVSEINLAEGVVFSTPISDMASLNYVWIISPIKE